MSSSHVVSVSPRVRALAYALLWNEFREKEFDHRTACEALKDDGATVNLAFSGMKKAGWLEVRINPRIPARGFTGPSGRRKV